MYYDVNNLYEWAMCQSLPYAEFWWVEDAANFDVNVIAPDSPTGYILKIDLEYPQYMINTLIYLSVRRAISRPASARVNF